MPIDETLDNLLTASDPDVRRQLAAEAAGYPEAAETLMATGQDRLAADPAAALRYGSAAVDVAGVTGVANELVAAWRLVGQAYRQQGLHEDALVALREAAAVATSTGNALLSAQVQVGAVDSLAWLGRFDEAVSLARRLESTLMALGAEQDAAKVVVNVANQYFRRDLYEQSLERYQRALEVLARFGDALTVARVQANAANALTAMGRIDDAIALYSEARKPFENREDPATATIDGNEGYLQYLSGKYALALASMLRARQSYADRGQELLHANVNADLASVYRDLNLRPEALECYESAISTLTRIGVSYDNARAEMGRSATVAEDSPQEALEGLNRAEQLFRAQGNTLQLAHVHLVRAYVLRANGQVDEACESALQAARTFSRRKQFGWAAEARFLLADVALELGQDAGRRMHAVARAARVHARGWLECRANRSLARYDARRGMAAAIRRLRAGIAALEGARTLIAPEDLHVAFTRDKLDIYEDLVKLLLIRGRPRDVTEALEVVERSRSRLVLERIQAVVEGLQSQPDVVAPELQARLASLRAELSRAYHDIHATETDSPRRVMHASVAANLGTLEQAYLAVLRDIQLANLSASPPVLTMTPVAPEPRLREALVTGEILVEYYAVGGELCAFVLTKDKTMVRYGIAPMEDVANASRRLRYHLKKLEMAGGYVERHHEELRSATVDVLEKLYNLVLEPLEDLLTVEKVVLVPYGVLHGLPFHALFDGARYALDRWEFLYAPSASIWYAGSRRSRRKISTVGADQDCMLLMAVPGPGTEHVAEEVGQIAALMPCAKVFQGPEATLEAFREHAGRSSRIHLATHAMYRTDNPLFSGLRLTDGWLLARDLYDIPLNCDLATLSACHTGVMSVESGDELFGLIRGFLCAGTRSLSASLWPADDASTTVLMTTFYNLLTGGAGKAEALRTAQRAVRDKYAHPYYWAAFALFGER